MSTQIAAEIFKKELLDLLGETFEQVKGYYLDRDQGNSLFETLETITAEQASRPVSATCACLAAQVDHVRYYLEMLLETGLLGQPAGEIDWGESWKIEKVTAEEWAALKRGLRETHQRILAAIKVRDVWVGEDDIGVALAILAHTAYHLGEIRQALCVIK